MGVSRVADLARTLRADLWTTAADPLPRRAGSRLLARLPHTLVVVYAVLLALTGRAYPAYPVFAVLAWVHAAVLVVAMFRPLPAWWASLAVMIVGSSPTDPNLDLPADPASMIDVADVPVYLDGVIRLSWSWTGTGMALEAGVLFLVALRVRPRVAAETLTITALVAAVYVVTWNLHPSSGDAVNSMAFFLIATVTGAALRGRRVARARLVEQQELTADERARRTVLETRNRIARELHDVVAHHMSVISIQAQVAPHLVENPPPELTENLAGIRENAVEALTELRRILGVLRSEDAEADGLRHSPQPTLDRLEELIGNVRGAGLAVTVETAGEPRPLSPGVELSAFRIIQEALSNVLRHAPGARVRVGIGYLPAALAIRVANTAPERPPPPANGPGHGLLGMRERTAMLGGELVAGPAPGGGFEVTAILPAAPAPPPPRQPGPLPDPLPERLPDPREDPAP
ncbi:sensor histidine kinase [Nonomuraea roseoviolacea]|uniref:histidine kinase n=1 Tax=Nonomuraea roseoviolacea subsp. carminata TaxID=160689 RepID=A0ABT1K855_9ACTN|nr:sensor histidine kinase [Nonomuraea roseoviolacea]MCP2350174.1 signal transduction histidine kinase [Nonomuraea roseoviolacea subsp. carminata]